MRKRLSFLYGMIFIATHRLVSLRLDINNLIFFQSPAFAKIIIFHDLIIVDTKHISQFINALTFSCIDKLHLIILTDITLIGKFSYDLCICNFIWNINQRTLNSLLTFIFGLLTFFFSLLTFAFCLIFKFTFYDHLVILSKVIIFDIFYQNVSIDRQSCIASFFQAFSPALIIGDFQVK